jgi:uncharacterized protein YdeI (YjbR/CyaY-like superfamily)
MASRNKPAARKSFTAVLEPDGTALKWVIARVPFDIAKAWPVRKGRRVRGEIEGFAFRTSLFPDPRSTPGDKGTILLVNKKMQAGAGARVGAKVRIWLEPDLDEREVLLPKELERELSSNRAVRKWFEAMSDSMRREIGKFVGEPKSAESRQKRAEKMTEQMMQAMDGEHDPPPILKAAFLRQPLVRVGWEAMTLNQRRGHLMGIFYYETPEARNRRAEKAIDAALQAARKQKVKGVN